MTKTKKYLYLAIVLFLFHPMLCGMIDLVWTMWTGHSLILNWRVYNPTLIVWTFLDIVFGMSFILVNMDNGDSYFDWM